MNDRTTKIAKLNDACRKSVMMPAFGKRLCEVFYTQGIACLSPEDQVIIASKVRDYDDFSKGNNPYGERDFGSFDHHGQKVFWKIDYYDQNLKYGSDDPADPEKTRRTITIMLAHEY